MGLFSQKALYRRIQDYCAAKRHGCRMLEARCGTSYLQRSAKPLLWAADSLKRTRGNTRLRDIGDT